MPSKFEYELTKLRGEVSESQELYTDTIASLNDKIKVLETKVTALDADLAINKQKTKEARIKASKADSSIDSCLKKSGSRLDNNKWIDNFQASNVIALKAMAAVGINLHDSTGAIVARMASTVAGLKADVIAEYTSAAGVTIDGVLIKDGLVDGLDPSGVAAGADVTGSNAPQAHKASHDKGGSDITTASKINTSAQSSPVASDMYFNTTNKKLYIRTGGSWYYSAIFTMLE